MNTRLEQLSAYAQGILDLTHDLPEQYAVKVEELIATIFSVVAMADGVHTTTISAENLVEGRNVVGDGVVVYKENGLLRIDKEQE